VDVNSHNFSYLSLSLTLSL